MRLINADKLRENIDCKLLHGIPVSPVHEAYNDGVRRALDDLDDAETVEAIPIEWIIKWVKNWKPYTNVKSDVFYMLEDWGKENASISSER